MTLKGWATTIAMAASLVAVGGAAWTLDRAHRSESKDSGASEEKFTECCNRVDALDRRIAADQQRQDEGAVQRMQRIAAIESRMETEERASAAQEDWWKRRIEAQDVQMGEILTRLGRIEGKLDTRMGQPR
jgi:hypothetical protein